MTPPTIRRLSAVATAIALAVGASACGDGGPRATPLPPGADVTLVDSSSPTTSAVIEGDSATPTSSKPAAPKPSTPTTTPASTSAADRDLDQIEADLRQLDQDLSRSSLSEEGAVQ